MHFSIGLWIAAIVNMSLVSRFSHTKVSIFLTVILVSYCLSLSADPRQSRYKPARYLFHWLTPESLRELAKALKTSDQMPLKSQEFEKEKPALMAWSNPLTGQMGSRNEVYASANRKAYDEITGEAPRLIVMKIRENAVVTPVFGQVIEFPGDAELVYQYINPEGFEARQWVILNSDVVESFSADPWIGRKLLREQLEAESVLSHYYFRKAPHSGRNADEKIGEETLSPDSKELHSSLMSMRIARGQALDFIFGGDKGVPKAFLREMADFPIDPEDKKIEVDLDFSDPNPERDFEVKGNAFTFRTRAAFAKAMVRHVLKTNPVPLKFKRRNFSNPIEMAEFKSIVNERKIRPIVYLEMFESEYLTLPNHGIFTYAEPAVQWEISELRDQVMLQLRELSSADRKELKSYLLSRAEAPDLELASVQEWFNMGLEKEFPEIVKKLFANNKIQTPADDWIWGKSRPRVKRLKDMLERKYPERKFWIPLNCSEIFSQ